MFFGPFLPIVPLLFLLEYLPDSIGEPLQAVILGGAYKIIEAINFDNLRAVYTKAKYLHRNKLPYFKRLKELNKYCKQVNDKNLTYPSGKFCTLIKLPVVLKITPLIDAMGWALTR